MCLSARMPFFDSIFLIFYTRLISFSTPSLLTLRTCSVRDFTSQPPLITNFNEASYCICWCLCWIKCYFRYNIGIGFLCGYVCGPATTVSHRRNKHSVSGHVRKCLGIRNSIYCCLSPAFTLNLRVIILVDACFHSTISLQKKTAEQKRCQLSGRFD